MTVCLGIESTAHTFGVGIAETKGKKTIIHANSKDTFHAKEGLIPRELFDHHVQFSDNIVAQALEAANLSLKDIDCIAFSQGPGIGQALRAGAMAARILSLQENKPLLPVNHCIAHLEIGRLLLNAHDPLLVYASGGNTQLIGYEKEKYRVYGETLDIGIGNLFDSFGRVLKIGFPAGPTLDTWYTKGKTYLPLPYTVKGMDLHFSGLLTAAEKKLTQEDKYTVTYSLMQTAFAMLAEVTERALAHTGKKEILLAGGVACSPILQDMMKAIAKERKLKCFIPERQYLVDNGAMIAAAGLQLFPFYKKSKTLPAISPKQRADAVPILWR